MSSQNRETPRRHRQLLNLPDKIILKGAINMLLYKFLASTIHGKNISKIAPATWNDKFKLSHAKLFLK